MAMVFIPPFLILFLPGPACCDKGIALYYIRYDIKSTKHRIVDENLLMVPCRDEFRAENFSSVNAVGVISAANNENEHILTRLGKESAIISLLRANGLRSVTTRDYDTVISYEGAIKTPVLILEKGFIQKNNSYFVKISADFSPVAFPDRWNNLKLKNKIKKLFSSFILLFK